jgi:hypothetical protein
MLSEEEKRERMAKIDADQLRRFNFGKVLLELHDRAERKRDVISKLARELNLQNETKKAEILIIQGKINFLQSPDNSMRAKVIRGLILKEFKK